MTDLHNDIEYFIPIFLQAALARFIIIIDTLKWNASFP